MKKKKNYIQRIDLNNRILQCDRMPPTKYSVFLKIISNTIAEERRTRQPIMRVCIGEEDAAVLFEEEQIPIERVTCSV